MKNKIITACVVIGTVVGVSIQIWKSFSPAPCPPQPEPVIVERTTIEVDEGSIHVTIERHPK